MNMMDLTMIMITPDNVLRIVNYKRILFRPLSLQKNSVPCRISSNTSLILMWSKLVSNPQLVAARSLTCTHAHTYLNTPSFESRFRSHPQRTILHFEDLHATSFFFFLVSRHHILHSLPPHRSFAMASEVLIV